MKVNKSKIAQFPILIIQDKNSKLARSKIQERVDNCVDLPTNFVLEYAKMAKDATYIKKNYDKLDPHLLARIHSNKLDIDGLIGSLFKDEENFNEAYWLNGLKEAGLGPVDDFVPF